METSVHKMRVNTRKRPGLQENAKAIVWYAYHGKKR